jgi:hypothetical protein
MAQFSSSDQLLLEDFKKQWQAAKNAGNTQGMEDAHRRAEDLRAAYGYSGGTDGSQYIPLEKGLPSPEFTPPAKPVPLPNYPSDKPVQPVPLPNYPSDKPVKPVPLPNYPTYPEHLPSIPNKKLCPAEPPSSGYIPQGTYNDAGLSPADQARIEALQLRWQYETARGNTAAAERLHEEAEKIRAGYGYSGGGDGSGYLPTNLTPGTPGYVAPGTYTGQEMSPEDNARIESLQYQWQRAMEAGDVETAKRLHEYAEAIRARYGFSGGEDGSQYIPLDVTGQTTPGQTPAYTPGGYYEPPTLPSANSAEQYIKELYAARQEAILQAYKTAYDANVNTLDAAAAKIPAQYQAARNQAAAQSEIQKANFNEYAAASGLNSGAGGQAMLAMGNQLQGDLSGLGMAEADALSDLELQRTQIATQYQNDIAQAIADGKLEEASALYGEFVRIDTALRDTAIAQAQLNLSAYDINNEQYNTNRTEALQTAYSIGDFSGMAAYGWSPELIAAMEQQWLKDNPD